MIPENVITRCIRQEPKAQYELYRGLYPVMMAICTRYERDRQEAAATMNQAFLKILENIGKRRQDVPFEPWVRRITINTVIDQHRKDRLRPERMATDIDDHEHDSTEVNGYLERMEAEAFAEMLRRVPPMSRTVFNLFAIDGFQQMEVAEMLGISEGTVKWHVSNARQVLRNAIAAEALARTEKSVNR